VAIERRLQEILAKKLFPLLPFSQICKRILGQSEKVMRDYFPELAKGIGQRFLRNRELCNAQDRELYTERLKDTARLMHRIGIAPNYHSLASVMPSSDKLRSGYAKKALYDVRVELGYYADSHQLELAIQ
jgi:hypothetical protein